MQLNLPHYEVALQRGASGIKIFDRLRNKYVALTPEEWVRQHFIEFLIKDRGFPPSLMGNEVGLTKRDPTPMRQRAVQCKRRSGSHHRI